MDATAGQMIRKTLLVAALGLLLAALPAAVLARPSGAAHRTYTIAYFGYGYVNMASAREAAKRLGVRVLFPKDNGSQDPVRLWESMIARHVDAIVTSGPDPAMKPIYRKVRKAGILLISSEDDIVGRRDLWVSQSDPVAYAQALADALASQIGNQGEYAILEQQGEYAVADTWAKVVEDYIPKAYPQMKLDGVLRSTGNGDPTEVASVKTFMAAHPKLKGLIGITPTEAVMAAEAITQAGRIGQVFSAGNGDDSLTAGNRLTDPQLVGYVRTGAAELVFASDPVKQAYVTIWATHYLLTGHRFRSGAYQVGAPIGRVWYYAKRRELRVGSPVTITKANLGQ